MNDLESALHRIVRNDVQFDQGSKLLYSTDTSIYQMEPIGVIIPRDADDVRTAITVTHEQNVALLPRGGSTSLTNQTMNRALVMNFTRYMNEVIEVNVEEQ